ncbi:MAG: RDD family protein [Candidatus Peribacteraceae bacterium]
MTKLATPQDRFFAKVLDWGLMAMPLLIMLYTIKVNTRYAEPQQSIIIGSMTATIIGMITIVFIQWVLIGLRGQSIGKVVMHIKIVDGKRKKVGTIMQNLVVRTWVNGLLICNLPYFLADSLLIFRKDHSTIHDFIAGTIVVKAK